MDRIIKGIMKYRKCHRDGMVKQFQQVRDHPEVCQNSFVKISRDSAWTCEIFCMLVINIRNAGNIVPHSQHFVDELTMCEPAALELGCVVNSIRHVIVCGHSDCKAMNLLYALRDEEFASKANRRISPLRAWLCAHASSSLAKFQQLEVSGFHQPIVFQAETPLRKFVAYIDPEDKFSIEDKLSQINTLQQLQNVASYGFLKKRLERHDLHIHALWFDIYTGDIYYFSRGNKRFVEINELTETPLLAEIKKYYS
ncbi:carbonic anhydrase beta isoform X2 [Lasioglossum baleicum]|uniref:carbonic anhydrase beta isoform X2 n=1 Tax=Lasioglossum baleicum TaxID=434251 RepID=UPI003FCDA5A7